jgi:amino acid adenylation domain-containing protein
MLTGSGAKHLLTGDAAELPVSDVRVHPLDGASEWRPTEVLGHDLAYVMYTSGSTGGPKGVMVAHDAVCNDLLWRQRVTTLGHGDRLLHTVSFAFDPAMWQLFGPLVSGTTVVLADHEQAGDPARLVSLVRAEKVTIADFVPSLLTRALDAAEPGDLASLRHVFCGGERLSLDLTERLHATTRAALHNQYGPTEATIDTTSHTVTPGDQRPEIPIGRPIANKRVYVLDDRGEPIPPRVTGELWISGKGLAYGYTGNSRQTAARFRPDPHGEPGSRMYRSGDLARFRGDGVLEFAGRVDDQMKLNGVRIEPAEIEDALRRHPTVTEAVVVTRAVEGQTALAAYVTSAKGSIVDTHALRLFLTRLLPPAFLPTHFVVVERIPLGVTGKVDVSQLPQVEAGTGRSATPGSAEAQLATLWAEVLGRENVPVDTDFFQLGGDSQLAMRVIVAIRERFGTTLSLAEFFEAPTVERLAARSDTAPAEPAAPPLTRRTRNRAPLSYAQERVAVLAEAGARPADLQLELNGRLRGELDLDVLADALDALVVRHDALRVRVEDSEQFVVGPYPVLGGAPLSLADGRLLAAEVTTLGANEHQLTLRAHRIAVDGATTRVLANDLAATYCALRDGLRNPLPPLTVGYPDFAVWERGWLTADVVAAALEDWRAAATGFEPLPKFGGGSHVARTTLLGTSTATALTEYGRQHDASLRTVLLTAFTGAAQRVLGTLPVCVPVNGHTDPALAGVVGRFVNLAALLPGPLTGEFPGRLAHLRAATVEGYQRQRFLPFTALEDAVGGPGRDRLRGPIFPLMFDLADRTGELTGGTGLRLVAEPSRTHWTDFGLALQAHHIEDRLELVMLHDPDIHDTAGALHEDLLTQLSALARQELDR